MLEVIQPVQITLKERVHKFTSIHALVCPGMLVQERIKGCTVVLVNGAVGVDSLGVELAEEAVEGLLCGACVHRRNLHVCAHHTLQCSTNALV